MRVQGRALRGNKPSPSPRKWRRGAGEEACTKPRVGFCAMDAPQTFVAETNPSVSFADSIPQFAMVVCALRAHTPLLIGLAPAFIRHRRRPAFAPLSGVRISVPCLPCQGEVAAQRPEGLHTAFAREADLSVGFAASSP